MLIGDLLLGWFGRAHQNKRAGDPRPGPSGRRRPSASRRSPARPPRRPPPHGHPRQPAGLPRWPTPAPAPACPAPATPGVTGSGRLTAALRQSHRPRRRQPIASPSRQLRAPADGASDLRYPQFTVSDMRVLQPSSSDLLVAVCYRHLPRAAPRTSRSRTPAPRSQMCPLVPARGEIPPVSAPTGANRTSSLAPRQRSGRSTSRDTERRMRARLRLTGRGHRVLPGSRLDFARIAEYEYLLIQ